MADVTLVDPGGLLVTVPEEDAGAALQRRYRQPTPEELAVLEQQKTATVDAAVSFTSSAVLNDPLNPLGQLANTALGASRQTGADPLAGLRGEIAGAQERAPMAALAGEIVPQVGAAIATGGGAAGLSLGRLAAIEAAQGAAYAAQSHLTDATLRDRAIDGEKLLIEMAIGGGTGALGAGLGRGAEVGLSRLLSRPTASGLDAAATRMFGEAAPGVGGAAERFLARGQSILGGVDEDAARSFSVATAQGRANARRAVKWERELDTHVRDLTGTLEQLRGGHQAVRGEWGSVAKQPHIAKLVKRGNEAQTLAAARSLLAEGDELVAALRADPLKYGGQAEVEALAGWIKRYGDDVERGASLSSSGGGWQAVDNATVHHSLDEMKKQIDDYVTKPLRKRGADNASMADKATAAEIGKWRSRIAQTLEDSDLFGDAGLLQKHMNRSFSGALDGGAMGIFDRHFTLKELPGLDPANSRFVDPTKVTTMLNNLTNAKKDRGWQAMRAYVDNVVESAETALKYMDLPPEKATQLRELAGLAKKAGKTIDDATEGATLANQLRAMERSEGLSAVFSGGVGGAAAGYLLGGEEGAALGAVGGAFMRPASMIRKVAALTELTGKFDGKLAAKIGQLGAGAARSGRRTALVGARAALMQEYERRSKLTRESDPAKARASANAALAPLADAAPTAFQQALAAAEKRQKILQGLLPAAAAPTMGQGPQTPSYSEVHKYLRIERALDDPSVVLDDLKLGTLTRDAVDAVREVYPETYAEMQRGLIEHVADLSARGKQLPYVQRTQIGLLFDLPTDPTIAPKFMQNMAASYAEQPAPAAPSGPKGGGASSLVGDLMTGSEQLLKE